MCCTKRALLTMVAIVAATLISAAQTRDVRPVTDETLRNPSPNDWLHWRRTSDGTGYSPLDQINRQTVGRLQLAWAWSMEPGNLQATPLVHDGVMYLPNPGGIVQALDAATGDLLWEYRPEFPDGARGQGATRSLSIYEDKIFLNTPDARLVALDARTGSVVWSTQVADPKKGFSYRAGSLIVQGKVISGLQGCSRFYDEKCAITAHDARTGKEIWRTLTVAMPGDPGDNTWGDVDPMFRAGTDMWITGSYDAGNNLILWGVSQAKPWARAARGTDGDALYSNSTLALDPDTGKMVWFYQYLPGETQDMDEVFERILVDHDGQSSVFSMGKLGILWEVDRKTGKFVNATDLGYQNILNVDPKTGKVAYRPGMIPTLNQVIDFCPSFSGVKSWRAMAYHPDTRAFYIPALLTCQRSVFTAPRRRRGAAARAEGCARTIIIPQAAGTLASSSPWTPRARFCGSTGSARPSTRRR